MLYKYVCKKHVKHDASCKIKETCMYVYIYIYIYVAWTFRVYLALPFCLLFKRFNSHIQFVGFRFKAKFMA